MGDSFAKIAMGALIVIAIYNIVSSPNSNGIVQSSTSGGASIIHALEGK